MKLDLNLLSMRFSQAKETPAVSTDSVNPYLLEKILQPCMDGQDVYIGDIDFDAFDVEDIGLLAEYLDKLILVAMKLAQFTEALNNMDPIASRERMFC